MIKVTKEVFDNFIKNKAVKKKESWDETDYFDETGNLVAHSWGQACIVPHINYQIDVENDNSLTYFLVGGIIDVKTR